jgi:hypothetical protein
LIHVRSSAFRRNPDRLKAGLQTCSLAWRMPAFNRPLATASFRTIGTGGFAPPVSVPWHRLKGYTLADPSTNRHTPFVVPPLGGPDSA